MTTNDNEAALPAVQGASPDPHGQAALLLVESLIHGLCENAVLSARHAVEIAERAVTVQKNQAEETEGETVSMWRSHALLSSIAASLKLDDVGGPPSAHPLC